LTLYHGPDLRVTIGFHNKEDWCNQRAFFTDNSLVIGGHTVMEHWQKSYMKALTEIVTRNGGSILEVGYGLGLAAQFIQKSGDVMNHVIIECHPDVIRKCKKIYDKEILSGKVALYEDFWENITFQFLEDSFNGILFDTYPLSEKEIRKNHFFFFNEAYRLLRKGGVLTYYSDEDENFSKEHLNKLKKAGFKNINSRIIEVKPPKQSSYWKKGTMLAPIIIK